MNWRRSAIAALVAAPFVVLLAWGLTRDPHEIPSPLPGRTAPDFTLGVFLTGDGPMARPVGDTISLAKLRGNVVVVNFWASWCLSCVAEHGELTAAARRYGGQPVQFVGVLYNDVMEAGKQWVSERGGQAYPALFDPGARTAIEYGLYGAPETYIIDPAGVVAHKQTGPISAGLLQMKIDSILAASPAHTAAPDR